MLIVMADEEFVTPVSVCQFNWVVKESSTVNKYRGSIIC